MRYRFLIVSLVGLLAGCQSLCPLKSLRQGTPDINDPGLRLRSGPEKCHVRLRYRWIDPRSRPPCLEIAGVTLVRPALVTSGTSTPSAVARSIW